MYVKKNVVNEKIIFIIDIRSKLDGNMKNRNSEVLKYFG